MRYKVFGIAVACILILSFFAEDAYEIGYDDGWIAGYAELEQECKYAYEEGCDDGYDNGYDDGYDAGYDEGFDDGYTDGYGENEDELYFWRKSAVIVTTTGEKYHTYGCYHIEGRRYWIYNIELAKSKGYTACLDCVG